METVGIFEVKTHLTHLLDRVAAGEQIGRLVPVKAGSSGQLSETIARLKEFSRGQTLGGLQVKDLINCSGAHDERPDAQ